MKKFCYLILICIFSLLFLPKMAHAARSTPFLGVGIDRINPQINKTTKECITPGKNYYNLPDLSELGPIWTYNWTISHPNPNCFQSTPDPVADFGKGYIPMVFGCGGNATVQNWITQKQYEGYVLYLNEPDNGGENGGSNCAPETAVTSLANFISWKNTYKQQTGKTIDIVFGGVYSGPDMCIPGWCWKIFNGNFWIDEFKRQWDLKYSSPPDIAGFHMHVYAWNIYEDTPEKMMNHFKRRMEGGYDPIFNITLPGWNQWLDQNPWARGYKNEVWITETGVLNKDVPRSTVDDFMTLLIPYFEQNNRITRVAWFIHGINPNVTNFAQTSLMDLTGSTRTTSWNSFRNLCTTKGYCIDPNMTPIPTATLTPSPTIIPTNTPTLPPTATPTLRPTNTITLTPTRTPSPIPSRIPTSTPTRVPSATFTPTPTRIVAPSATPTRIPSPTLASGTVIRIKDATVVNNLITNDYYPNFACAFGKWCKWQRVNTSTTHINANGSISIRAAAQTGPYGSCWLHWIQGAKADGSRYRIRATFDSDFPTNTSFIQLQTYSTDNYLRTPWYTTGRTTIDEIITISDANPNYVAIKFCSWGTSTTAFPKGATLKTLSVEKM